MRGFTFYLRFSQRSPQRRVWWGAPRCTDTQGRPLRFGNGRSPATFADCKVHSQNLTECEAPLKRAVNTQRVKERAAEAARLTTGSERRVHRGERRDR